MKSENPYRPPSTAILRAPAADDPGSPLKDTRKLAVVTTVLISLFSVGLAARFYLPVGEDIALIVAVALAICYLSAAICHLVWAHRTAANAWRMEPRAGISPGWTVWGYIIPLVSLVAPVVTLTKIAKVTFRAHPAASNGALLAIWWTAFLVMNFAIRIDHTSPTAPLAALVSAASISILMNRISMRQADFRWEQSVYVARQSPIPASPSHPKTLRATAIPEPRPAAALKVVQESRSR